MFSVPIKVVFLATTLAFVAMVLGSFIPTTLLAEDTSDVLIDKIGDRITDSIQSEFRGLTKLLIALLDSTAATLTSFPSSSEQGLLLMLRLMSAAEVADYIHIVSVDGTTYYGLKAGDVAENDDWQFSVLNASLPCRTDFNISGIDRGLNSGLFNGTYGNVTHRFCGYQPLREKWVVDARASSGVIFSGAAPQVGQPRPHSCITMAVALHDPTRTTLLGVLAISYSMDKLSEFLSRISFSGNSGSVLIDVHNGQFLAASWTGSSIENNPLYDTSNYSVKSMNPQVTYRYMSPRQRANLGSDHLDSCVWHGFDILNASEAVLRRRVYHTPDPNHPSSLTLQCHVIDIVDARVPTMHFSILVFIEGLSYTVELRKNEARIGITLGVVFLIVLIIQSGILYDMTTSINNVNQMVHETLTKKRRAKKQPVAQAALSSTEGAVELQVNATPVTDNSGDTPSRRSLITEICTMQDKLQHFGQAMNQFVPTEVVAEMLLSGRSVEPSVTPTTAVILFVDIESFTTMCEALDPGELSQMLSIYYEKQCESVNEHGGVVDKFIGDCVMALWGAPRHVDFPEARAICAALHLRDNLSRPDARALLKDLGVEVKVRVGVAKGTVLAGSMGSSSRLAYTALGDSVNLAARLEAANKYFGTRILCNAAVVEGLRTEKIAEQVHFVCRDLGTVQVYGKKSAQNVYQIVGVSSAKTLLRVVELRERTTVLQEVPLELRRHSSRRSGTPNNDSIGSLSKAKGYLQKPDGLFSNHSGGSTHLSGAALAVLEEIRHQSDEVILPIESILECARRLFNISDSITQAVETFNEGTTLLLQRRADEAAARFVEASVKFGKGDKVCGMFLDKAAESKMTALSASVDSLHSSEQIAESAKADLSSLLSSAAAAPASATESPSPLFSLDK